MTTPVNISHQIGNIRQPRDNDCWAASLAMVVGMRHGRHRWCSDIQRTARGAGVRINNDGSLPRMDAPNTQRLATALSLRFHNLLTPSFNIALVSRILLPGAFALFGDFSYSGQQQFHVIAVYRLYGDGTNGGTTISYVDPYTGRYINKEWSEFYNAEDGGTFLADAHFAVGR